ncbi:MAG: hypothetical protein Q9227_008708 [Pyrenula ochraceoflavens]
MDAVPAARRSRTDTLTADKGSLWKDENANIVPKFRVGIIGAGVAGLFTAMIFDHLQERYGLDVHYEILEANEKQGSHDYFDVGATRLPNTSTMSRFESTGADDLVWDTIKGYGEEANYKYSTIEFLETMEYGNRWYDQVVSEMILETLDFDTDKPWRAKISFVKKVTTVTYSDIEHDRIDVTVDGGSTPKTYHAVFNSAPLGAMQHMHLEGLNLNWGAKSAIRSLEYKASCKVGIRFKSLWWMKKPFEISRGGQGKTELPIRCCVYPSFNIYDDVNRPGVLPVSYTWSQEADRIDALISRDSPKDENELKSVLIHDLARLHATTGSEGDDNHYK